MATKLETLIARVKGHLGQHKNGLTFTLRDLAAALHCRPGQVWEWLNGTYRPNGEITLALLAWCEAREEEDRIPFLGEPQGFKTPIQIHNLPTQGTSGRKKLQRTD